jgi:hypothetical protein
VRPLSGGRGADMFGRGPDLTRAKSTVQNFYRTSDVINIARTSVRQFLKLFRNGAHRVEVRGSSLQIPLPMSVDR